MEAYLPETYGEAFSEVYDDLYQEADPKAIEILADLAGLSPALELGIGTGRYALPLQEKGVCVHGVDASPAMLRRLQAKPRGNEIQTTMGSFSETPISGSFSLVYVVFNTIFALLTQEEQVRCFKNVARLLSPGGCFLIEAFIPDLLHYDGREEMRRSYFENGRMQIDITNVNLYQQQIHINHVILTTSGPQVLPVKMRFAFPAELDLIAQLAGLRLRSRWGDWNRSPCTCQSGKHISIYELNR